MRGIIFMMMAIASVAQPDARLERKDWSVMTVSHGGKVSLIPNLSLANAVRLYASVIPDRGSGWYIVSDGDIDRREIIGPEGWDGCTKAFNHDLNFTETVCEGGPNKGLRYKSADCSLCHQHKFEWIDQPKQ